MERGDHALSEDEKLIIDRKKKLLDCEEGVIKRGNKDEMIKKKGKDEEG